MLLIPKPKYLTSGNLVQRYNDDDRPTDLEKFPVCDARLTLTALVESHPVLGSMTNLLCVETME